MLGDWQRLYKHTKAEQKSRAELQLHDDGFRRKLADPAAAAVI
jgi:hypothetical protein